MPSYASVPTVFRRLLLINIMLVSSASAAPHSTTLPALIKAFLIPVTQKVPPPWGVGADLVRWKKPTPMAEGLTSQPHLPQLDQEGSARVRMLNQVWTASISMMGPTEFPDEVSISIYDPSLEQSGGIYDFNFPKTMKKAGFVLEKTCADDSGATFGDAVYTATAAGYQPVSLRYSWEVAAATHGSSIYIVLALTKSAADKFKCYKKGGD